MTSTHLKFLVPGTLEEAQAHLCDLPTAVVLAGGQHLVPRWRETPMPDAILSLSGIETLKEIALENDVLSIGAGATLHDLASSPIIQLRVPALSQLASRMGDCFMRNRATVGGALCTTAQAGCLPAAMIGLDATLHTTARRIALSDWFSPTTGPLALERGELITRVTFPLPEAASHQFLRLVPGRFSLITVFASKGARGVCVGISGLGPWSFRARAAQAWMEMEDFSAEAAPIWALDDCLPKSDVQATADYRQFQARRLLRAAGEALAVRAGRGAPSTQS